MAGVFQGAGNWRLDFIDGGVLVNCSYLSPNQESYTVDLKNNRIVINTTPKPLVLTLRADGNLAAPGSVHDRRSRRGWIERRRIDPRAHRDPAIHDD
jgi:hypothetical protein